MCTFHDEIFVSNVRLLTAKSNFYVTWLQVFKFSLCRRIKNLFKDFRKLIPCPIDMHSIDKSKAIHFIEISLCLRIQQFWIGPSGFGEFYSRKRNRNRAMQGKDQIMHRIYRMFWIPHKFSRVLQPSSVQVIEARAKVSFTSSHAKLWSQYSSLQAWWCDFLHKTTQPPEAKQQSFPLPLCRLHGIVEQNKSHASFAHEFLVTR